MKSARTWSLKIILIGNPSVGKTSLRRAYLGEKFRISYISTIGSDFSFKQLSLGEDTINASIWDLAGQTQAFVNIHPQYYRGSAGALVVYDVTNRETFESVRTWVDRYQSISGSLKQPILIVGNKIDLIEEGYEGVTEEEQEELIEELRATYNNEFPILSSRTSAKTGKDINTSFEKLVKEVINWQQNRIKKRTEVFNMEDYIKTLYVLTFHDAWGPKILFKHPGDKNSLSDLEYSSVIKVATMMDFEDIIKSSQVTGDSPWSDPTGNFYYIAFALDNEKARGKKSLYIIGFTATRDINELISKHRSVINGFLHAALNEFSRFIIENHLDFTSEESTDCDELCEKFVGYLLSKLQKQIFSIIEPDLH